jgi:hypothetical protein
MHHHHHHHRLESVEQDIPETGRKIKTGFAVSLDKYENDKLKLGSAAVSDELVAFLDLTFCLDS